MTRAMITTASTPAKTSGRILRCDPFVNRYPRFCTPIRAPTVASEIVAFANGFDLLVIGSSRGQGIERWLSDSITEKVAQAAPCPVLIVRQYKAR